MTARRDARVMFGPSDGSRIPAEDGSRFWTVDDLLQTERPFGADTLGIVDEEEGGIVAYVHKDTAPHLVRVLRERTGEI